MASGGRAGGDARLKPIAELERVLRRRYERVWADELLAPGSAGWPYEVRVGRPSQRELERSYAAWDADARRVRAWAEARGLACRFEKRRVGRRSYGFLSHVCAQDVRTLAAAVGQGNHFARYARRLKVLRERFVRVDETGLRRVLVDLNKHDATDDDFALVCQAAEWFAGHDVVNMTAREVPLEGFHAKWLDVASHRSMVCALAGIERLEFRERPHVVRFRYLDPNYLAGGGRVHDCWVEGDCAEPAYVPSVVVVCENRDSALWFKPLLGGIAIQGDGMSGATVIGRIEWVMRAPCVLYWGDIDRQGFQILSKYREEGLDVQSLLMDEVTYERFERFGTRVDRRGHAIGPLPEARELPGLTADENALYLRLCAEDFTGSRRIEQERIPLDLARRTALDCIHASPSAC